MLTCRISVEILFRKGFLRLVIATGTLALGINMPCKTVVFSGDSIFLTAQNYRQASGRAGRRGFDLLGNVVFNGLSDERVHEIMSSRLPALRGQFPISTTLVLRLCGLLEGTKNSKFASQLVGSLLSQTRLYMGGPEAEMSMKHHLRFSIEYLRRQKLLSATGTPLHFAKMVGHLYFTENAVFAFHALLKGGYFHEICKDIDKNPEKVHLEMMVVLSHLFNKIPVRRTKRLEQQAHRSSSVVFLERLPEAAERMLLNHNLETLSIYKDYVHSYVQHNLGDESDDLLPFTRLRMNEGAEPIKSDIHRSSNVIRSSFAALSGHGDEFESVKELCQTVRGDVHLEQSAVPYLPVWPVNTDVQPNAYLYDFFKHGSLDVLVRDNEIKRGEVWFFLKDFSLTLATIVVSLQQIIHGEEAVPDDALMELQDDLGESPSDSMFEPGEIQEKQQEAKKEIQKAKVPDSWDDTADDAGGAKDGGSDSEMSDWDADDASDDGNTNASWKDGGGNLPKVLQAFLSLRAEFDATFRKVWA